MKSENPGAASPLSLSSQLIVRNKLKNVLLALMLTVTVFPLPLPAGDANEHVHYVGGTISALPGKTDGYVNTRQEEVFLFQTKGVTVQVPYDKINVLEYGQRVSRRYVEAILFSPVFLLSKTKKHYLTVGFTDDQGRQQAMIFEVGKNDVRAMLVVLEAKSGRKVEYQDDDARRGGKGS
jgi:hypothetical protein